MKNVLLTIILLFNVTSASGNSGGFFETFDEYENTKNGLLDCSAFYITLQINLLHNSQEKFNEEAQEYNNSAMISKIYATALINYYVDDADFSIKVADTKIIKRVVDIGRLTSNDQLNLTKLIANRFYSCKTLLNKVKRKFKQ